MLTMFIDEETKMGIWDESPVLNVSGPVFLLNILTFPTFNQFKTEVSAVVVGKSKSDSEGRYSC